MPNYADVLALREELNKVKQICDELNEVIDNSFDGIVICDVKGKIIYQNQAFENLTGLKVEELVGRFLQDLIEEGILDQSVSLKVLETNKPETIIQKFNTGKVALVSGVPIRDEYGEIKKVVSNIRDLAKLNQLEEKIIELEQKKQRVNQELEELQGRKNLKDSIIAHDENMKQVVDRALRVAQIDSAVLIQGESGVGKEGLVNLIHQYSNRNEKSLIKINCGAIPAQLLESELFGYESGSFTGANQKGKKGILEMASGGTVFFDEISEMPLSLQVKLLRVLQEYEIVRIGGVEPIKIDVRIIAATNRNLEQEVVKGTFRKDLYYRINIIPIYVPKLQDRKDDIIPLVYHFLNEIKSKYGISRAFSDESLYLFKNYPWPGNVRELKNLVERVCLMINKPLIEVHDIKNEMQFVSGSNLNNHKAEQPVRDQTEPLKESIKEYEINIIQNTISKFSSIRMAAKALQIDQSTLVRKIKKYNIQI